MALVVNSDLPAFDTMRAEGVPLATPSELGASTRPQIAVALLNLMPDAALRATDRQFMRLVAAAAEDVDITMTVFTVAGETREEEARLHIKRHYTSFEQVAEHGSDALIVTGANPAEPDLEKETFWEGLSEVLDWAQGETRSIMCSCLATHAVLERYREMKRTKLPRKRWGVYQHRQIRSHPLLEGLSGAVEAPHSHWYDVARHDMEAAGLAVLLESDEAGVHMAVDDEASLVFFQGHPEYDLISLLKEYRRELGRFWRGDRDDYPPVPEHYFDDSALAELEAYRPVLEAAKSDGAWPPRLVEEELLPTDRHTWNDAGKVIYQNWLRGIAEGR